MRSNSKKKAETGFPPPEEMHGLSPDPAEAARYIAEMAVGLRTLARRAKLRFLIYLLDMVAMEALEKGGESEKLPHSDVNRTR